MENKQYKGIQIMQKCGYFWALGKCFTSLKICKSYIDGI